jgi:catechol 2,3-dioxygenase-like lactoylglutathione lyase family enzyme
MSRKRNARRTLIVSLVLVLGCTGMVQAVKNDFHSATIDVGIVVSDVEKSVKFYRDALGFTEVSGFSVPGEMAGGSGLTNSQPFDVRIMVLGGEVNATKIKLMQVPQGTNKKVDHQFINSSLGLSYLTIFVKDTQKAVERCRRAGVQPIKPPFKLLPPMKYLTLVRDPDGNLIEFVEPGFPTHADLKKLDEVGLVKMAEQGTLTPYFVHSMDGMDDITRKGKEREFPKVYPAPAKYGDAPADALVLFDGTNFKEWQSDKGGPVKWKIQDGFMEVTKKAGGIRTKKEFGSCQLHIEFATPPVVDPSKKGQSRGNSGVFFMDRYEVQVLDSYQKSKSYDNPTYCDGQTASIYGQAPPFVNVSKKTGEWQTYDIAFLKPVFDNKGLLVRPARITIFHNGVCVHNNYIIRGTTYHKKVADYSPHRNNKGRIALQDHGNPMRFRNIWIRELPEEIPSSQTPPPQPK